MKKVMFGDDEYILTENDEYHTLTTDKDKDGFKITINFTKDKERQEQGMKAIKEFMIREIFS